MQGMDARENSGLEVDKRDKRKLRGWRLKENGRLVDRGLVDRRLLINEV